MVEANGFSRTIASNVNVTVVRQHVDLTLQVATATRAIVVTDGATSLQTRQAPGRVFRRRQMVALQSNGRSKSRLLAPGVRESSTNSSSAGSGREAALTSTRATMNEFSVTA